MKKIIIATAVALTMGSGAAMAAGQQSDVQFFGNVSAVTCDVAPVVDGNISSLVQLGTVAPSATGNDIPFALKAADPTNGACTGLLDTQTATISWFGPFEGEGLANQGGSATGSVVLLKAKGAKTANQAITAGKNSADFAANKVIGGFEFTAALKGGATAGDFKSAAAYAVTYQ